MLKRKSFILLLVLSLVLLTIGCSSSDSDDYVEDPAHGLKVDFDIPSELLADVSALTIEENINIKEAEVELYKGEDPIDSNTLEDPLENNEMVFDDVKIGEQYEVQVELKGSIRDQDSEVKTLYQGENTSSTVESDTITTVEVEVDPLNAESLDVSVDSNLDVAEVTLKHTVKEYEKTLTYDDGVLFENGEDLNLIPARWSLIVKLEDQELNIEDYGGREILLLPTEEKEVTLDIDVDVEGDIDVEIIVSASPDTPTNLRLDESGDLIWDEQDNIKGYNVYKTETDNPDDVGLPIDTVENNSYSDVEEGYYYWVRAYDSDGYSSGLSEAYQITDDIDIEWNQYSSYYEINYPVDWDIVEEGYEFVVFAPNEGKDTIFIAELIQETEEELEEEVKNELEYIKENEYEFIINGESTNPEDYKTTINGFLAYEVKYEMNEPGEEHEKIVVTYIHNKEHNVTANLVYISEEEKYENNLDIAEAMVDSFVFLDSELDDFDPSDKLALASSSNEEIDDGEFNIEENEEGVKYRGHSTSGSNPEPLPMYMLYSYLSPSPQILQYPIEIDVEWSGSINDFDDSEWSYTSIYEAEESVTVLAGTFDNAVKVTTEITFTGDDNYGEEAEKFGSGTRNLWFAPGVGLLKLTYEHDDGTKTTAELKSYDLIDADDEDYFPLEEGNEWEYEWENGYQDDKIIESYTIK